MMDDPFLIPRRFPKSDCSKGKWIAYSNADGAKIIAQGNDKEIVLQRAKTKGRKPPILIMECK